MCPGEWGALAGSPYSQVSLPWRRDTNSWAAGMEAGGGGGMVWEVADPYLLQLHLRRDQVVQEVHLRDFCHKNNMI